jgi:glycosyltransferase involved in cell wall biosynthesis
MTSVLICTSNRASELNDTLTSINQSLRAEEMPFELIVIDNASTDETGEVIRRHQESVPHLKTVREGIRGLSYARHAGLRAAKGEVILFTDDDVRVPEGWLSGMSRPIVAGTADAVCGGVRIYPPLVKPWMTPDHRSFLASTETINPRAPERLVGANMAFRRTVLDRVRGFDVELGAGALGFMEDTLFSHQLKTAGFKIASAFEVEVEHHPRVDRFARQAWLDRSIKQGISQAYVDHHWKHKVVTLPRARALKSRLRLAGYRFRNPPRSESDGVDLTELNLVRVWSYFRRFITERKRPRHYEPLGLARKDAHALVFHDLSSQ